jgi:hypothetical protein
MALLDAEELWGIDVKSVFFTYLGSSPPAYCTRTILPKYSPSLVYVLCWLLHAWTERYRHRFAARE